MDKCSENIRKVIERLPLALLIEDLAFLSPNSAQLPLAASAVPNLPACLRSLAHACFVALAIRNVERGEKTIFKSIYCGAEGGGKRLPIAKRLDGVG